MRAFFYYLTFHLRPTNTQMSKSFQAIIQLLIAQPPVLQGVLLAVYIILAIMSYVLAANRRRNPLTFLALLMVFGLSSLQIARLAIPESIWRIKPAAAYVVEVVAPEYRPLPQPQSVFVSQSGDWSLVQQKRPQVAQWRPNIEQAVGACGLQTPGYDAPLLMASIVTQESGGQWWVIGGAYDTGLAQVVPRENPNPVFRNRPSQQELLDPQFNLNFAACLLRDNIARTGSVVSGINAYNGNGIHGGRAYAEIILEHYASFTSQESVTRSSTAEPGKFPSAPVAGPYRITQVYHAGHPGLDIGGATTVVAVMDGVVRYVGPLYRSADGDARCALAGCLGAFAVVLDHGGGTFTVYGHNSCTYVQAGQPVRAGQPLGCVGSEGKSTGPHVHFELRANEVWNGNPGWPWRGAYRDGINPTQYLP